MKIGILTYHRSINNGAFMQCYSLFKKVSEDFPDCDVEVIDFHMPKVNETIYPTSLYEYFRNISLSKKAKRGVKLLMDPFKLMRQREKKQKFEDALTNLKLSRDYIYSNNSKDLFDYINSNYNIVIAGSDAIWNYNLRGYPNPYFLDKTIKAKMLSYAASCFGMSYENIDDIRKTEIRNILNEYEFLGVRDDETKRFAEKIGVTSPIVHTCDPTVFLDMEKLPVNEEIVRNVLKNEGFDFNKPAVAVMGNKKLCNMVIDNFANNYQIVSLFNYCKKADVNLYNINPFIWAYVFRFFKITFTTYFHGTLLSLKNAVPVICVALNINYNRKHVSKIEDFLGRVGLSDCYFPATLNIKNISSILNKANELLTNQDFEKMITQRMKTESETYRIFKDALNSSIENSRQYLNNKML